MGHFSMAMIVITRGYPPSLAAPEWKKMSFSLGNLSAGGNVTSLGSLAAVTL